MLETSTTGLLLSWRRGLDRQVHAPMIPVWLAVLIMIGVDAQHQVPAHGEGVQTWDQEHQQQVSFLHRWNA